MYTCIRTPYPRTKKILGKTVVKFRFSTSLSCVNLYLLVWWVWVDFIGQRVVRIFVQVEAFCKSFSERPLLLTGHLSILRRYANCA